MVIGSPGAGKSTFSRKLQLKTNLPIIYLDQLFWKADRTTVSLDKFANSLKLKMKNDSWIMDGTYANVLFNERLNNSDTVFLLDYSVDVCLSGVRQRIGKKRLDLPWIETKEDKKFMNYIRLFPEKQKHLITAMLEKHSNIKVYHFRYRQEADNFLDNI